MIFNSYRTVALQDRGLFEYKISSSFLNEEDAVRFLYENALQSTYDYESFDNFYKDYKNNNISMEDVSNKDGKFIWRIEHHKLELINKI